jgi:hypothetical protein
MSPRPIACLAWGSLVWNPRELKAVLAGEWHQDGPELPIEFARASDGGEGRLTLVLVPGARPVPVLWAEMRLSDVAAAKEALRAREGCLGAGVGSWPGDAGRLGYELIQDWAQGQGLDHVIWTALGPLFDGRRGVAPSCPEAAILYLRSRPADVLALAEEYVRKAPRQVATEFRAAFEREFGWTPRDA